MSLLELIARRVSAEASAFSLPDLLAEQAVAQLLEDGPEDARIDNARLNLIIAEFFALELLKEGRDGALRYSELLFQYGITERRFLGQIIPRAADALGRAWEEDRLTFSQVTQASGDLMEAARSAMAPPPLEALYQPNKPRALLMRTPGEDHTLGLILTAQDLRRRGWLVRLDLSGETARLATACKAQQFEVIGFTIASRNPETSLNRSIAQARMLAASSLIVVGGALVEQDPEFATSLDADLTVGRSALALEQLVRRFAPEDG